LALDIDTVAGRIVETQLVSGEIPWSPADKTDPWDHVEAAMGLTVGGHYGRAARAFDWLAGCQLDDGSWYSAYRNGVPEDQTRDANQASYIAVGLLHYYLVTRDRALLCRMWPVLKAAVDFAVRLQAPGGEIYWAVSPEGQVDRMALLTGSSSVFLSLKCAISISRILAHPMLAWEQAVQRLGEAIRNKPHHFNMTKSRFSMDWFYPVLSGAVTGYPAQQRIHKFWKKFIMEGQGVRCVSDQPWVTVAETSELCIALCAMGNPRLAEILFSWICDKRHEDGSYWCGFTCPDIVVWPEDKVSWTNAVVLMALDALYRLTPASDLFSHEWWGRNGFPPGVGKG
jgi:hypothetical protein